MVVLIHDQVELRSLLSAQLCRWKKYQVKVEDGGYNIRIPSVWQRWIQDADLFVLGLDRSYDKGIRAEGVMVGLSLYQSGKKALVVGAECMTELSHSLCYWDICSPRTFLEAVDTCLQIKPNISALNELKECFVDKLVIPTGH